MRTQQKRMWPTHRSAISQKLASAVTPDLIGDAKLLRSLANKHLKQALALMQPGESPPDRSQR